MIYQNRIEVRKPNELPFEMTDRFKRHGLTYEEVVEMLSMVMTRQDDDYRDMEKNLDSAVAAQEELQDRLYKMERSRDDAQYDLDAALRCLTGIVEDTTVPQGMRDYVRETAKTRGISI